jgi:hypothetical protein
MKFLQACLLAGCATLLPAHAETVYDPKIDPTLFSSAITHPLFSMPAGKTMVFEGKTEEGIEREEITITGETKKIMGVNTLVYLDKSSIDGVVHEVTRDYLAQNKDGSVWYFGEEVDNYIGGKLNNHHGTWLAGKDNAKPGIWMQATPVSGVSYRQEYYKGEAEDMGRVIATNETVKVKAGEFTGCTKTFDWTPLEPDLLELKYFCPGVAAQVLAENLGTGERFELISSTTVGN